MKPIPCYRHLYGFRDPRLGEQLNDFAALQDLYDEAIPPAVTTFLQSLSDCILFYGFDTLTKTGKPKRHSYFVTTNVGPELASPYSIPASLIGRITQWRASGMPKDVLPLMMKFSNSKWFFCHLNSEQAPVCMPRGDSEFGETDREWTEISSAFDTFIEGLTLDLKPLLDTFRVAGTGRVDDSMRRWLVAAVGEDWESQVSTMCQSRKRKRT
jgi:hypothetical protein